MFFLGCFAFLFPNWRYLPAPAVSGLRCFLQAMFIVLGPDGQPSNNKAGFPAAGICVSTTYTDCIVASPDFHGSLQAPAKDFNSRFEQPRATVNEDVVVLTVCVLNAAL